MTPEQRENLRVTLLSVLDANGTRWGLPTAGLLLNCRNRGVKVEGEELERELDYLVDKGFVTAPERQVSPENRTWRITAAGRDFLAERGL